LVHLCEIGDVLIAGVAEVFADYDVFAPEFSAELVEIEHGRETWAIADEEAPFAIKDISSRTGNEDPALALEAFSFARFVDLEELLIGHASREHSEHECDQEI
jgi:hypothetical protein